MPVQIGPVFAEQIVHAKVRLHSYNPGRREPDLLFVFAAFKVFIYEWKCDALNQASRKAAERLGFTYEGCFRQAVVYKGRTRDTDWLSIIDQEWPAIKERFEAWLDPTNFDENGQQKQSLADMVQK